MQRSFADREFIGISVVTESDDGNVPGPDVLDRWRAEHGLSGPVLADPGWAMFREFFGSGNSGAYILAPGMEIVAKISTYDDPFTEADVEPLFP